MKRFSLILSLALVAVSAHAGYCGLAPLAPPGTYALCVCDNMGNNCQWVFVAKR